MVIACWVTYSIRKVHCYMVAALLIPSAKCVALWFAGYLFHPQSSLSCGLLRYLFHPQNVWSHGCCVIYSIRKAYCHVVAVLLIQSAKSIVAWLLRYLFHPQSLLPRGCCVTYSIRKVYCHGVAALLIPSAKFIGMWFAALIISSIFKGCCNVPIAFMRYLRHLRSLLPCRLLRSLSHPQRLLPCADRLLRSLFHSQRLLRCRMLRYLSHCSKDIALSLAACPVPS